MSLTIEQVKHIAKLSRLHLTEEEITKYQAQLSKILDYITELNEVDTSEVEPAINTTGAQNRLRDDTAAPSLTAQEALSNTDAKSENFFIVPNVFNQ